MNTVTDNAPYSCVSVTFFCGKVVLLAGSFTPLSEVPALPEIKEVCLMKVCLAFERYSHIGVMEIPSALQQSDCPFNDIDYIKRYPGKFANLRRVYPFMI